MVGKDLIVRNIGTMMNSDNCGEVSDGDHTFADLYHHRAILTMGLFNSHPEMCWKAKKHHDGTMYDGYFIVGMETPYGQATYHYEMSYWTLFHINELDFAPEWDGDTPEQVI